jgi:hypothetical protein
MLFTSPVRMSTASIGFSTALAIRSSSASILSMRSAK